MDRITQIDLSSIFDNKPSAANTGRSASSSSKKSNFPPPPAQPNAATNTITDRPFAPTRMQILISWIFDMGMFALIFSLTVLLVLILGSIYWGDYIHFVEWVEANFAIMGVFLYGMLIFEYLLILLYTIFKQKTPGMGMAGLYFSKASALDIFIRYTVGLVIDFVFLPVNVILWLIKKPSISHRILKIQVASTTKKSLLKAAIISILALVLGFGGLAGIVSGKLLFAIGRRLTDYDSLALYAVKSNNIGLLQDIYPDYQKYAKQADRLKEFYKCYIDISTAVAQKKALKDTRHEQSCVKVLTTKVPDKNLTPQIYKLIAIYYDNTNNPKKALTYYEYFYNNKLVTPELVRYVLLIQQLHPEQLNKVLDTIFPALKDSKNNFVKYTLAKVYFSQRKFPKTIELLQSILDSKPRDVDILEVKKMLAQALFLNSQYKKALELMKDIASQDKDYESVYKSYLKYYNTQIRH